MGSNVYLIGFMGTGKSTVGRRISQRLGREFFDTDNLIEEEMGMSIPDIFETHGEEYFRGLENQTMRELSKRQNSIVSTGGGTPLYHGNIDIMKASGLTINLHTSASILWDRLRDCDSRPILKRYNSFEKFCRLYEDRGMAYDRADITVITDGKTIDEIVHECIELILD